MHPWWYSTGTVLIAAWIVVAVVRAAVRRHRRARAGREKTEWLARLASDMRMVAARDTGRHDEQQEAFTRTG